MRIETDAQGRRFEYDDDGLCRHVRVPAFLMDSNQQADDRRQVAADADRDAAYEEMVTRTSNAWRQPQQPPATEQQQPPADAEAAYEEMVRRTTTAWQGRAI